MRNKIFMAAILIFLMSFSGLPKLFVNFGGKSTNEHGAVVTNAPLNLIVPPMAFDQNKLVLEWQKPDGYYELQDQDTDKRIVDYEVFRDDISLGFSNANFLLENPYLAMWGRAFYEGDPSVLSAAKSEMDKQHRLTYLSYTARGLQADTEYSFKVRAIYADGQASDFSDTLVARTQKSYTKVVKIDRFVEGVVAVNDASNQAQATNASSWLNASVYRRANFGASIQDTYTNPDFVAVTKSTATIQNAIDNTPFGGKLVLSGSGDNANPIYYVTGAIYLHSYMTFEIETGAVLLGSPSIDHYPRNLLVYPYSGDIRTQGLLNANTSDYGGLKEIRVVGGGIVDGNGVGHTTATGADAGVLGDPDTDFLAQQAATLDPFNNKDIINGVVDPTNGGGAGQWRLPKYMGTGNSITYNTPAILSADAVEKGKASGDNLPSPSNAYNTRPQLAIFRGVHGLLLEGLTWVNPSFHGIVNYSLEGITSIGTKVMTFNSNNGDGIEFGDSLDLHIINNFYDTGDDAINFAAGQGAVVRNTTDKVASGQGRIINNYVRNGHGFVVGGSHTGGNIGDILAEENIYKPSETGGNGIIRLKSGANTGGGDRNFEWRDGAVWFANTSNMLIMDRSYSDSNASTSYAPESEVPVVYQNINFKNVTIGGVATAPLLGNNASGGATDSYKMIIRDVNIQDIDILSTGDNPNAGKLRLVDIADSTFKNISYHGGEVGNKGDITDYATLTDSRNLTIQNINGDSGNFDDMQPTAVNWQEQDTLSVVTRGNEVTLGWLKVANATQYIVLAKENNRLARYFVQRDTVQQPSTGQNVHWVGTLSANTSYQVAVVAVYQDANGNSGYSDYLTTAVTTSDKTLSGQAVTMPDDLAINKGQPVITGYSWQKLNWNNPLELQGVQYFDIVVTDYTSQDYSQAVGEIEYRVYYDSYFAASSPLGQARSSYALSDLKPDTNYMASVQVVDWAGEVVGTYDDFRFRTFIGTLNDLPQWDSDARLSYQLIDNSKTMLLSWESRQHTDPSRNDQHNRFAGYRVTVDGVAQMTVSAKGEIANQVNAVPNTMSTRYALDIGKLTPGKHTVAVEAGVEILTFYSNAPSGDYQDKPILGDNNTDVPRNNTTMGKWTMHGPSVDIVVENDGTVANTDSVSVTFANASSGQIQWTGSASQFGLDNIPFFDLDGKQFASWQIEINDTTPLTASTNAELVTSINKLDNGDSALVSMVYKDSPPNTINKNSLLAKIYVADTFIKSDYTKDTWDKFDTVLKDAKAIYEDENATQAQIDSTVQDLQAAVQQLQRVQAKAKGNGAIITLLVIFGIVTIAMIATLIYTTNKKKVQS